MNAVWGVDLVHVSESRVHSMWHPTQTSGRPVVCVDMEVHRTCASKSMSGSCLAMDRGTINRVANHPFGQMLCVLDRCPRRSMKQSIHMPTNHGRLGISKGYVSVKLHGDAGEVARVQDLLPFRSKRGKRVQDLLPIRRFAWITTQT